MNTTKEVIAIKLIMRKAIPFSFNSSLDDVGINSKIRNNVFVDRHANTINNAAGNISAASIVIDEGS